MSLLSEKVAPAIGDAFLWADDHHFKLQCEARYWLRVLYGRVEVLINDCEDRLVMGTADDVRAVFKEFAERIIKKRGAKGAKLLFMEMMWQRLENDNSPVINGIYRGGETLQDLLMAGAGCDKKRLPIQIQTNRD